MPDEKKPEPITKEDLKREHLAETFPDEGLPKKPFVHTLPPDAVAAAKAWSAERASRGNPVK